MGKLDPTHLSTLSYDELKTLETVEFEMRKHQLVPREVIAVKVPSCYGGIHKILQDLCRAKLLCYERGRKSEGYRLTNQGYDYIALKHLVRKKAATHFGDQVGVGKESNIYSVHNEDSELDMELCLKLHRLGRTCFRNIKNKRDYIPNNAKHKSTNWLILSKTSARKEFNYMKALYDAGFPVPTPVNIDRHCVVMEFIVGTPLKFVHELHVKKVGELYDDLMSIIVKFATHGCIHGDFNEFNIILKDEDESPVIIDFPQMVSTQHANAKMLFLRDVNCIKKFFWKRFRYTSDNNPTWKEVQELGKLVDLDKQIYCPGFNWTLVRELDKYIGVDSETFGEQFDSDDDCDYSDQSDDEYSEEEAEYSLEEGGGELEGGYEEELGKLEDVNLGKVDEEDEGSVEEESYHTCDEDKDDSSHDSADKDIENNDLDKIKKCIKDHEMQKSMKGNQIKEKHTKEKHTKEKHTKENHTKEMHTTEKHIKENKESKSNEVLERFLNAGTSSATNDEYEDRLEEILEQENEGKSNDDDSDQNSDIDNLDSASVCNAASKKKYLTKKQILEDARQRAKLEYSRKKQRENQKRASKLARSAAAYKSRKNNIETVKEYKGWGSEDV